MKLWILPLVFLTLTCTPKPNTLTCPCDAREEVVVVESRKISDPPDAAAISLDSSGAWSLHFSPNGGCEEAIVNFIGGTKGSLHMMAYGFTELDVANALIGKKASGHGMDIEVILDRSDKTAKGSMANVVNNGNVPVWIDSKHAIAHNKVIIRDGTAFETGSYNYTGSAEEKNAENCLIEEDPAKAALYEANFQLHKSHSDRLPLPN